MRGRLGGTLIVIGVMALGAAAPAAASKADAALSSRLQELSSPALRSESPADQNEALSLVRRGPGSLLRVDGAVVVEIRADALTASLLAGVRQAGAEIVHVSRDYETITAIVDEGDLLEVGQVDGVDWVQEVITPMTGAIDSSGAAGAINTCATGVVSEGNTQLKAGAARAQFDVDGTGVEVGVMSDSYDTKTTGRHAAEDVASGDLPGPGNPCGRTTPVQVIADNAGPRGDEGRAMAQIVHDIAPGADLAFATAIVSQTAFADNIKALANAGADVIVDDIIFFAEPFYQDGPIANSIREVTGRGISYFSMAFNNNGLGLNSYETPAYRPTTCPAVVTADNAAIDDCMDFDPTAGTDNQFDISVTSGPSFGLSFDWAQAQQAVNTDFDLYLLNTSGTAISFDATEDNIASQVPFEFLGGTIGTGGARQVVIARVSGTATPRMKFVSNDNGANRITATQLVSSPDLQGPTIYGHNGTASAQTVGAVPFNNASIVEPFSSHGPVTHLFGPVQATGAAPALVSPEVLSKPDVAATDGGINTFFGSGNRFFGTSAAAPHAAAVAALQLEANPTLSQAQVKAAQRATAVPVGALGANVVGSGLIDARAAIASNPPPAPGVAVGPVEPTADNTPSIPFAITGDAKTITCQVDGGAPAACASPFTPASALQDGEHTLTVGVGDYFNQSGSGSASVIVDTKAPSLKIKKGPPKRTTKTKAKFKLKLERGSTAECQLDRERPEQCGKKAKFKVDPGKHKLLVTATDAVGNESTAKYRWKVLD